MSSSVSPAQQSIFPYIHGEISRDEAQECLTAAGGQVGMYLIRQKGPDYIVTFVGGQNRFAHNILSASQGVYTFDGKPLGKSLTEAFNVFARSFSAKLTTGVRCSNPRPAFFHGKISREESEERLKAAKAGPGAFLARESAESGSVIITHVNTTGGFSHVSISQRDGCFIVDGVNCRDSIDLAVSTLRPKTKPPLTVPVQP